MIAAANFTYLIGICMPNIAAWLLRRDLPDAAASLPRAARHHHARRGRRLRSGCSLPFSASSNSVFRPSSSASPWPIPAPLSTLGASSRIGGAQGLPADRPDAARQAHRRHAVRARSRWRRLLLAVSSVSAEHHELVSPCSRISSSSSRCSPSASVSSCPA